jgi:hypothetical protein
MTRKMILPVLLSQTGAGAAALALLLAAPASGREKPKPAAQTVDAGSFRVEFVPARNWQAKVIRASDGVVFQYVDAPARTMEATIGVFRLVVPPAARGADRLQLAAAYAVHDVAGAQKALFRAPAGLVLLSRMPQTSNGGELLGFVEPVEKSASRTSSTMFIRAWVLFPPGFATNGALYLILGREQSTLMEPRPSELDKADEIIAGIREP